MTIELLQRLAYVAFPNESRHDGRDERKDASENAKFLFAKPRKNTLESFLESFLLAIRRQDDLTDMVAKLRNCYPSSPPKTWNVASVRAYTYQPTYARQPREIPFLAFHKTSKVKSKSERHRALICQHRLAALFDGERKINFLF